MITLLRLLFLRIFLFVNTLYFSIVLLLIVLALLYRLVSGHILHSLTMLILVIVYVGAMIILIGYICAVCPNLILTPVYIRLVIYFIFFVVPNTALPIDFKMVIDQRFVPLVNYFYSYLGIFVFLLLILMLFVTLLMVTSQYMTPKGPFRSVDV